MIAPGSVLIVDQAEETRDTLRAVLEHRGWPVSAAASLAGVDETGERFSAVVVDMDAEGCDAAEAARLLRDRLDVSPRQVLVLASRAARHCALPRGQVISKPYHYAPLIHKIESLAASISPAH